MEKRLKMFKAGEKHKPRGESKPEVLILLMLGFPPKFLIDKGCNENNVYGQNKKIPKIKERMIKALSK